MPGKGKAARRSRRVIATNKKTGKKLTHFQLVKRYNQLQQNYEAISQHAAMLEAYIKEVVAAQLPSLREVLLEVDGLYSGDPSSLVGLTRRDVQDIVDVLDVVIDPLGLDDEEE